MSCLAPGGNTVMPNTVCWALTESRGDQELDVHIDPPVLGFQGAVCMEGIDMDLHRMGVVDRF